MHIVCIHIILNKAGIKSTNHLGQVKNLHIIYSQPSTYMGSACADKTSSVHECGTHGWKQLANR